MVGVVLLVLVEVFEAPLVSADQAVSASAAFHFGGKVPVGWRVQEPTLGFDGHRPFNGVRPQPSKCFGASLPIEDGYCLPYPTWKVHMVHVLPGGSCEWMTDYVDARRGEVVFSASGPCISLVIG